ncbi:MAG: Uma2 family endonuclease [gamma proteobacterium symbiont of Lucinoma myriamae]|nr:Uma2 family endonuclease [gamma proteobacterium symbiont of Lucinoma myriamae]MCU7819215.1 Uma2 family endonuclease [gamma proteobacterium symbiont of Lucinoma myriamae]MCU7832074.1 Uma2 family endonuclease [gamma proteobacterium symbiont of Lucinoma myriamae]
MEAHKLKTIDDLMDALKNDERLELINGEIIKRPMARAEHGAIQTDISGDLRPYIRREDSNGWWIMTEISVQYNEHQCPIHDIAGWRKERVSQKPKGVMKMTPDWVCEITSPGHISKDTITILNLLKDNKVPYYWIIDPEEKALTVYQFDYDSYKVIASIQNQSKVRLQPFPEIEFDLDFIFG